MTCVVGIYYFYQGIAAGFALLAKKFYFSPLTFNMLRPVSLKKFCIPNDQPGTRIENSLVPFNKNDSLILQNFGHCDVLDEFAWSGKQELDKKSKYTIIVYALCFLYINEGLIRHSNPCSTHAQSLSAQNRRHVQYTSGIGRLRLPC